jgi:hypothetical protein
VVDDFVLTVMLVTEPSDFVLLGVGAAACSVAIAAKAHVLAANRRRFDIV